MSEEGLMVVSCPSCSQRFRVRQQSAGRAVKCPHCAQAVSVPHSTATTPTANQQEGFQLGPPDAPQSTAGMPAAAANGEPSGAAAASTSAASAAGPVFDPATMQPPAQPSTQQVVQQAPAPSSPIQNDSYSARPDEANPFQSPSLDLAPTSVAGLPAKRRYPALQIIRTIYLVGACLVGIGWALFMVGTLIMAARVGAVGVWLYASLAPTAGAAFAATMMVAMAEFIKLALDIQSNTLSTARATSSRSQ